MVHASALTAPINGKAPTGEPISGSSTILELARQLVNEKRELLPVNGADGKLIGVMDRQKALDILLGEGA